MGISWCYKAKLKELLDSEKGAVVKSWGDRLSVALVYPNLYHVAMSNLGFHRVYSYFNSSEEVVCERAFLPDKPTLALLERRGEPAASLESQSPLGKFDVIAFSVSFETDYINALRMLRLSKIALRAEDRDESSPLVIWGGASSFCNPEPMAPFVDLFVVGEVEGLLDEALGPLKSWRKGGLKRIELLKELARSRGAYAPAAYEAIYADDGSFRSLRAAEGFPAEVERRVFKGMDDAPAASRVITEASELGSMYLVEVGRGCARNCWFCLAGNVYRPPRHYSKDAVMKEAMRGLCALGKVGLVATAAYDHPDIGRICGEIIRAGGIVSISSLRVDALSDELLEALAKSGHKTISLGIEAGSERLRKAINKGLTEDQILCGVARIQAAGIPNLKLYLMVGLPGETGEGIYDIIELVKKINHLMVKDSKGKKPIGRITLSLNCFVPKPFTPFQWEPMEGVRSLNEKIRVLKSWASKVKNINLICDLPKWAFVQGLLARGDRKVADLIAGVEESGGDWYAAMRRLNLNPDYYVRRARDYAEPLPWDHIDVGVPKDFLIRESGKSRRILAVDEACAGEKRLGAGCG